MEIGNIISLHQLCDLTGYTHTHVKNALMQKRLTAVYPFPNKLGRKENTGIAFVLADALLERYLIYATEYAKKKFNNPKYDCLNVALKHLKFL